MVFGHLHRNWHIGIRLIKWIFPAASVKPARKRGGEASGWKFKSETISMVFTVLLSDPAVEKKNNKQAESLVIKYV